MHGKVSIQTVRKTIRQDPNTQKEIIVCPGGAYATLSAFEGEPVARFFAGRGWNASVCEYGVEEKARMPGPLLQLAQAVAQARRENDFVAVCGFSAGANLAALLCTRYEEAARLLDTKPEAVRPDAAVLGYGVYRFPAGMVPQPAEKFGQVSGQSDRLPKCFRPALRQTAQGDRLDFEALTLEYAVGRQDPSAAEWRSLSPAELAGPETPPPFSGPPGRIPWFRRNSRFSMRGPCGPMAFRRRCMSSAGGITARDWPGRTRKAASGRKWPTHGCSPS